MTTQQATVLSEIVSNAARAAESAAEAARALREAQERPRNNFSEASKVQMSGVLWICNCR